MKKLVVVLVIAFFALNVNAQWKLGAHVGAPVGDYSELFSAAAGFDAYKMFGTDKNGLLKLGVGSGFVNYFVDGGDDNVQYIPVAGAARLNFLLFTVGPDIGYSFGISDGMDNNFYWKAVVGVKVLKILEIDAYYHSVIIDEYDLSSVGIAALIRF